MSQVRPRGTRSGLWVFEAKWMPHKVKLLVQTGWIGAAAGPVCLLTLETPRAALAQMDLEWLRKSSLIQLVSWHHWLTTTTFSPLFFRSQVAVWSLGSIYWQWFRPSQKKYIFWRFVVNHHAACKYEVMLLSLLWLWWLFNHCVNLF